jgi:mono/diheme cytochrome c family protein
MKRGSLILTIAGTGLFLAGCHTDMWVQPKHHHPYQESEFFADGNSSRPMVEGTVAYGKARLDDAKFKGRENGKLVTSIPATLTLDGKTYSTNTQLLEVLKRGKDRYHAYCSHCHGEIGDGKGMIAQRGFQNRPPATYHTDRLRNLPAGHIYDVITNGYGVMYSQSSRVQVDDRWAIVAYVRALQMSQNVKIDSLPADAQAKVRAGNAEEKK